MNMENKEKTGLLYGKKYKVGNYYIIKYNKVLRKSEIVSMRMAYDIPKEDLKNIERAQMPCIKVCAVSGIWSIEFSCSSSVYHLIEQRFIEGDKKSENMFAHIFNMWFMDTMMPGDEQYQEEKARALKAYQERVKAKNAENENMEKAKVVSMVKEGGNNGK